MLLKKGTFLIPSLITLIMSFPSPGFAQDAPNVATLRQLLDSIEGVAEKFIRTGPRSSSLPLS